MTNEELRELVQLNYRERLEDEIYSDSPVFMIAMVIIAILATIAIVYLEG